MIAGDLDVSYMVIVGILSLSALELEICLGAISSPIAGKRRKKPLPGEGLTYLT